MKKDILFISAIFASLLFFSCNETKDDNPVLNINPDSETSLYQDFLNKPEMANQMIELTQDNAEGYLHLTCSQPDYGFAAVASYSVELSYSSDFSTPVAPEAPAAVTLKSQFTNCAEINPNNDDVANAICKMLGLTMDSTFPVMYDGPLYVRLISNIYNMEGILVEGTTYTSNVESFYRVSVGYMAASIPDIPVNIYLPGGMNEWKFDDEKWQFFSTDEKGVYTLKEKVSISGGTEFKVADPSWGTVNEGSNGAAFKVGTPYKMAHGGGNLSIGDDFYGTVTFDCGVTLPQQGVGDIPEGLTFTLTFTQD